ncbi:hypothetical protein [Parafrankia sp. EUN1f]|uniref:phage integrase central domain-containing protein n=1 Tax=Parafrankia sp. EUN1f TaxID=102897 RepID=UPI0012F93556|nr:hypothetical protein [Parafrankia sp. EUN1f]
MPRTGRPPLGLGTYGEIRTYKMESGRYKARTLYRDFDGVTRPVARNGASKNAAEAALKSHLRDRVWEAGAESEITSNSRVEALADAWWAEFSTQDKSPGTFRLYRDRLDNQIIPALGKLRVRELTTGAANRHISTVSENNGAGVAKATRTVLSNMCAFACQRDVMKTNPIREVAPSARRSRRCPRPSASPNSSSYARCSPTTPSRCAGTSPCCRASCSPPAYGSENAWPSSRTPSTLARARSRYGGR